MSSARIDKLKGLLARVEQRRAQPRLRAVPTPVAAAPAPLVEESFAEDNFDDDELFAKTDPPPALLVTEKKPAKAPASPIEDALALLDGSGPLDVQSLAEPIAMKSAGEPRAEPPAAERAPERAADPTPRAPEPAYKSRLSEPDPFVTERPGANPSMPAVEFRPAPSGARPGGSVREPTLRFDTGVEAAPEAQIEIGGLESEPPTTPPPAAEARLQSEPPQPLSAPSQVVEAETLSSAVAPARAVSAPRIELPKSFCDLLELSLSLRPRQ